MPMWFYSSGIRPIATNFLGGVVQSGLNASFSFGNAGGGRLLIACCAWQAGVLGTLVCTIGGITATQICQSALSSGSRTAGIYAAIVPTGTSGSVVLTGGAVQATRDAIYLYSIYDIATINTVSATSTALSPTATLNIPANSSSIGIAMGGGVGAPSASWSGITLDQTDQFSQQATSAAHTDFSTAQTSYAETCTLTGSVGSAGAFAVFS